MIHIIVGDIAAKNLQQAQELDNSLQGEIIVLKDTLGIGPIYVPEGEKFSEIRTNFWKTIHPHFPTDEVVPDFQNILQLTKIKDISQEQVWFWMAPCVSDVCAYYWLLQFFKDLPGVLHTIAINGLPFFNEKQQLFYPNNFGLILPKEIVKCKKLVRDVSAADFELDGEEWDKLCGENSYVRIHDGGKKVITKNENYFDTAIISSATNDFQRAQKVYTQALAKITQTVSDVFIAWRLRNLVANSIFVTQGDTNKAFSQFEIKKYGEQLEILG